MSHLCSVLTKYSFLKKNVINKQRCNFKQIFNKNNKLFLSKYLLISVIGYKFIFISLYILIDVFHINKLLSFIIVYGITYLLLYGVQLNLLFYKKHDSNKLLRYVLSIIFFYLAANLIYFVGLKTGLHYFLSSAIAIFVLIPLRFLVYNFYVYKN